MRSVCIIGSGAAGLITAHTLLQDGFQVQLLSKDKSAGGVWARQRLYEGLQTNNVNTEFRFSPMQMPLPKDSHKTGGRLRGEDICGYLENFEETFLKGLVRYEVEVVDIRRGKGGEGWIICVKTASNSDVEQLSFDKVVLCTGGCHSPQIPPALSAESAKQVGFNGFVFHSSELASRTTEVLSSFSEKNNNKTIVVVGGGRSAQDISAFFAKRLPEAKVKMIFSVTDAIIAGPIPLPDFIRRSRLSGALSGHEHLRTSIERLLHTTTVGGWLTHAIWNSILSIAYWTLGIRKDSPLRNSPGLFWGIRSNDEGVWDPNRFYNLVKRQVIQLVAPARVEGYVPHKSAIKLSTGEVIEDIGALVLCTGFKSSWSGLLDETTMNDLGMNRHPPTSQALDIVSTRWNHYKTLKNPPPSYLESEQWTSSMYRGIIPWKNITRHDFAVNGAVISSHNSYALETSAHWISSYFLKDSFMRLPSSAEEALNTTEISAAWMRKRYPNMLLWLNESWSSGIAFWAWSQYTDDLLEDMGLPITRSGGNWLTWPFKTVSMDELGTLGEERRARREQS
ncbi:hypothetical protein DL96DRAFT_1457347 [Flagelloscypha sp. PMI_526]|nr:hypothetical protein DL96DRAFT_1457347 [Flagelloscypha sp. PMI_526]